MTQDQPVKTSLKIRIRMGLSKNWFYIAFVILMYIAIKAEGYLLEDTLHVLPTMSPIWNLIAMGIFFGSIAGIFAILLIIPIFFKSVGIKIDNSVGEYLDKRFLQNKRGMAKHLANDVSIELDQLRNKDPFSDMKINERLTVVEREKDELKSKVIVLEAKVQALEKEKSVKKQQIGEKFHAQDINENTKIDDENTKFERKN